MKLPWGRIYTTLSVFIDRVYWTLISVFIKTSLHGCSEAHSNLDCSRGSQRKPTNLDCSALFCIPYNPTVCESSMRCCQRDL